MLMRQRRGGSLSLIVTVTLVIIVLGIFCYLLVRFLGGARELQNAVDSGNLNVAKTSLRDPSLKLFSGAGPFDLPSPRLDLAIQNFSELRDRQTNELDLLTYNRAMGQTMLVAINAISDNYGYGPPNPIGISDAQTLVDLLANPTEGIGTVLANKLKIDAAMDNNFYRLASMLPLRMLKVGARPTPIAADKDIAFMVPSTASNLVAIPSIIPPEFLQIAPTFVADSTVVKGGTTYYKGYNLFNIPGITDPTIYPLMGVPLRPLEKPHLVSLCDFTLLKSSPLAAASTQPGESRIPPNAFKSSGSAPEVTSNKGISTLSCAITGTVNVRGNYPSSIPCGYVVVANGAGVTPTNLPGSVTVDGNAAGLSDYGYGGGARDIFSDVLMYNTVYVTGNGAMAQNPQAIRDIQIWKQQQANQGNPQTPVPASLANALDGPSPKQSYADGITINETPSACTNYNSAPGSPNTDSQCASNLASMASVYGTSLPSAGNGQVIGGLMALEKEKAGVINPRPSGGPAVVTGLNNTCTGMKAFNLAGIGPDAPVQFGVAPTIGNLLATFENYGGTAAPANKMHSELVLKLRQIQPSATPADIQAVLNQPLPMGAIRYIWLDPNGSFRVTDSSNLPPWINPSNVRPDGTPLIADTGDMGVNRTFVNIEGEQGFPSPWDCFGGPASTRSKAVWTRSSGFNCLQGVLRFSNCASDSGGPWHCPC